MKTERRRRPDPKESIVGSEKRAGDCLREGPEAMPSQVTPPATNPGKSGPRSLATSSLRADQSRRPLGRQEGLACLSGWSVPKRSATQSPAPRIIRIQFLMN